MQLSDDLRHQEVHQGKYALSIGTSIAIETLFGINDLIPPTNPLPYTKYEYIAINIRTLIRNIYGAIAKELKTELQPARYLEKVVDELRLLPELLANQSGGRLECLLYLPSYRNVERLYPHAIMRKASTKAYGRQHQEAIEQYCVAQITAMVARSEISAYLMDTELDPTERNAAILTHHPIDLISFLKSRTVDLLETHTGKIKSRNEWYTKLSGTDLTMIPFDRWSIQFFGDGKFFSGYPPKMRKSLIEFAKTNRWNQTTTPQLIKMQLKRMPDPLVREQLAKIL